MNGPLKHFLTLFFVTAIAVAFGAILLSAFTPDSLEETITIDVGTPFYQGGRGTAFLLFHGLSATPAELEPLVTLMKADNYTIYTPLLRGHGTTPDDLKTVTWEDWYADAEKAYMDLRATHDRVIVGGISLGGALSLYLASQHQDVDGVVTIGAPIVLRNKQSYLARFVDLFLAKVPHPVLPEERNRYYDELPPSSVGELIDLVANLKPHLKDVTSPLLLFQGTNDPTVEAISARYILENTQSTTRILKNVDVESHILIDDPARAQAIYEEIKKFVEG